MNKCDKLQKITNYFSLWSTPFGSDPFLSPELASGLALASGTIANTTWAETWEVLMPVTCSRCFLEPCQPLPQERAQARLLDDGTCGRVIPSPLPI